MTKYNKVLLLDMANSIMPLLGEFHMEHPGVTVVTRATCVDAVDVTQYLGKLVEYCKNETGIDEAVS